MKVALLLLSVAVVVLVAGCTSTGSFADREAAERAALDSPALSEEPCETVECGYREQTCPDGTVVQCQEQCARGLCQPCTVSCSRHRAAPAPSGAEVDLCAGLRCPTKAYCSDGSEVPCPSSCDPATGICSKCTPDCSHVAARESASLPASPPPSTPSAQPPGSPPAQPPSSDLALALSTDKQSITRGSTITVTATATRSGPAPGVPVHFVMTYASGSQQAFDATTSADGIAAWSKQIGSGSTPGTFTVTATSGSASATTTFEVTKAT